MSVKQTQPEHVIVSIVMPVFNGEQFLIQALDSILAQTFTNFELRIGDNCSSDNTSKICQEYANKDSRIIYHRHSHNMGAFRNAEWLYRKAKGKFVMLVGDDDVYEPNCIAQYVDSIIKKDELVLVYSNFGWIDEDGVVSASNLNRFIGSEDSVTRNLYKFIHAPSPLPFMMGLFRTEVVQQALPFPVYGSPYQDFGGGLDIAFLWKILPKGQIEGLRDQLFYYRQKNRAYSTPSIWGKSRWLIKTHQLRVNFILLSQFGLPCIWKGKFSFFDKLGLSIWAVTKFLGDFSFIPLWQAFSKQIKWC